MYLNPILSLGAAPSNFLSASGNFLRTLTTLLFSALRDSKLDLISATDKGLIA